jgi:hypothetical protein
VTGASTPAVTPTWMLLTRALGIALGVFTLLIGGAAMFLIIWAKFITRGRIMGLFIDHNSFYGQLLKIDGDKVHLGRGENQEDYMLVDEKQFWTMFPSGFPRIVQYPVRAHIYVRNVAEPYSPSIENDIVFTAKMVRLMSDEAVLKTVWKDVRETHGIKDKKGISLGVILLGILMLMGVFNIIMLLNISKALGG